MILSAGVLIFTGVVFSYVSQANSECCGHHCNCFVFDFCHGVGSCNATAVASRPATDALDVVHWTMSRNAVELIVYPLGPKLHSATKYPSDNRTYVSRRRRGEADISRRSKLTFDHFDTDVDGFISLAEVYSRRNQTWADEKKTMQEFSAIDEDGDGRVSYTEFEKHV